MRTILVAAGALNQTPIAWDNNYRNIVAAIKEAKQQGAQILCLPELCVTGYGCEDTFHSPGILATGLQQTLKIAGQCRGLVVSIGLPLEVSGAVYNAVCLIVDGEIVGFVAKQHLAGDGLHYEPRWFKAWPSGVVSTINIQSHNYPVGDLIFEIDGVRIGFEICEDAWVADRGGIDLAAHGVDIILNPSASHFAFGKIEIRKRFVLEGSRAFGASYVYANLLGCESGRIIYDGDTLIASHGEVTARGPRFSYRDFVVTTGTIDIERTRLVRYRQASFVPKLIRSERNISISGFQMEKFKSNLSNRRVGLGEQL